MKRGSSASIVLSLLGFALASCGYHPAYGGTRPEARLSVVAAPSRVPEGAVLAALLSGLRQELSRAGVLGPGSAYPRVVVELVRLDERGTAPSQQPEGWALARGTLVGVTARAWVEHAPSDVARDTGDIRRTTAYETAPNATNDLFTRDIALESAARSVGEALGRRVLGEIEVTQEPM